jgi:hypothetical protein
VSFGTLETPLDGARGTAKCLRSMQRASHARNHCVSV